MISSLIRAFHSALSSWVIGGLGGSSSSISALSYGGGIFVCYSNGHVYSSGADMTWVTSFTAVPFYAYSSTYGGSNITIMVGYDSATNTPAISTSTDVINWTSRSTTGFGSTASIMDICWSGTYFVVVSNEGHIATSSSSGSSWTQRAKAPCDFFCVAFGAGIYIAYGSVAWTSSNGTTWTNRESTSPPLTANDITYGASKFVAVGFSGKIYTTTDGITWTKITSPFGTSTIRKVTYDAGKFVAVGDSGKIATSTDGISWLLSASPVTTNLDSVAYGVSKFVAVGASGIVITSTTGL